MRTFVFVAVIAALAIARPAHAAITPPPPGPCANLPHPVYLQVGDTQLNLMKRLGRALRDNTNNRIRKITPAGVKAFEDYVKNLQSYLSVKK